LELIKELYYDARPNKPQDKAECLFVCTLYKFTFLNRSEPNFAHISALVWKRL